MDSKKLEWSQWYKLSDIKINKDSNLDKQGLYKIRAKCNGIVLPIQRYNEKDKNGLISIGQAGGKKNSNTTLRARITKFKNAINNGKASHSEGRRFFDFNYGKYIPKEKLEYCYTTFDKDQILAKEKELFHNYNIKFLDLPLLNRKKG